ncbi:MAG: DUF4293 family protein [Rhodothermales bacterium]|nr:DUF4293 family protein [Rhodothermales bacterium]MBO6780609.1 DUF4293 family protein [Rhodothermales bacterium]
MIQRIQTVWLLLGAVACAYGAWMHSTAPGSAEWVATAALAGFSLAGLLGVAAIFLYQNRDTQRKVALGAQYVVLLALGAAAFGLWQHSQAADMAALTTTDWVFVALPLVGFVLFRQGRRGVESDIKLLKSVDRLR